MANTPRLLDHRGHPVAPRALRQEMAAPTFGGARPVWSEPVLSGLNPMELAAILRQASRGYPDRFFSLAAEMEERDLHYAAVLGTRKRAITGVEPIVVAASNAAADEKIADAVRELVEQPAFLDDYVTDLLDALGKGYAIVETMWDRSATEWRPVGYRWRDQAHFVLDQTDGRTLRMKVDGDTAHGVDLPPHKFSIHRPKLKSGLPVTGGLGRLAAWAFLFKAFSLKDWMAFLEVFGMPLRVGKYGPGASLEDKRVLLSAVRDLSTDAAAIIPTGMEIEFVEAARSTGTAVFGAHVEYLDRQISKGVLGQTMTTDDGSSQSQATIHENVRHDIARADARQTAVTINRDLVRPFVDLNFGPQERYPAVVIPITEAEDVKALAEVVRALVPLGLEVSASEVRERVGFGEPEEGEPILKVSASVVSPRSGGDIPHDDGPGNNDADRKSDEKDGEDAPDDPKDDGKPAKARVCPACGEIHVTAAIATGNDELDVLAETALGEWEEDLEPLVNPLRGLFERASSYDELVAGLDEVLGEMDAGPLSERLAKLTMMARGLGDIG